MVKPTASISFVIPPPNIQNISTTIIGTAPLIFHKWSEKAIQMIQAKQAKAINAGKRETRNPQEEYEESFYKDSNGKIAFPALCIKQTMVNATRSVTGLTMTLLRGGIFIVGDKDGLIPVKYGTKEMRTDMVRVGMGVADVRYRGQVKDWSMHFLIKFNADLFSPDQVLNLLNTAGFSCGLGEWRPERNGDFGTFEVEKTKIK